ncbi:MAG TPA: DNA repair exonuclease [Aestuariivirgaceae bacterium]|nr:DNA repair exonuclease [Aestuariivirgaceae bacterium]
MLTFRFLHAADIHLDSPLRGLRARSEEAANQFAEASRKAFSNLVQAAIERNVAFVIIAGDLYDGDWKDYATGQFFVREAAKLAREGIKLFLIRGNHDAASDISRTLPPPDNMHEFDTRKVDSVEIAELSVILHGRSFAQRHVADNMAGGFPAARPGWCNIGILHTSLTGREGHDVYAPCSLDDLLRAGYQYWALGHVHAREVVHADPPVVFPGNLQGRHAREPGPKGATLVTVDNNVVANLEALELDAARWECPSVDITGLSDEASLHDAVRAAVAPLVGACEGRPLALRLRLTGTTNLHARLLAERERVAEDLQAIASTLSDQVWLEKLVVETRAPAVAGTLGLPLADLEEAFASAAARPEFRRDLEAHLELIRSKAPREALDAAALDIETVLAQARDLIVSRLATGPGSPSEGGDR